MTGPRGEPPVAPRGPRRAAGLAIATVVVMGLGFLAGERYGALEGQAAAEAELQEALAQRRERLTRQLRELESEPRGEELAAELAACREALTQEVPRDRPPPAQDDPLIGIDGI